MSENRGADPRETPEYWERLLAGGGRRAVTLVKRQHPGEVDLTVSSDLLWVEPDDTQHVAITAHGQLVPLDAPSPEPGTVPEGHLDLLENHPTAALRITSFEIPAPLRGKGLAPLLIADLVRVIEADHPELLVIVVDIDSAAGGIDTGGTHAATDRNVRAHQTIRSARKSRYLQSTGLAGIVPQEWLAA